MRECPIYLDHNSTPVHQAVLEAMLPNSGPGFGNRSSAHVYGYRIKFCEKE